ncbi:S9 family peptidase [Flavobacterium sp. MAH-1]|uniref:S9 family peptidase n=1 Tax=Flavobacterium agri TaxID=2743471 RepID=A0A7Y9C6Z4_9FLAO|nr:prolyl oligopeptidase family serine peptidase [Flavobacterium agri]NUY81905.1 S9 family peptidase [Flavobacterium agri]NYA71929.1 S9 family peptidase [Flavobacterium agri]
MKLNHKTIFAFLPFLAAFCTYAQQKKHLRPEEYGQWYQMAAGTLSHNGKWMTYSMQHTDGRDTLFLKNTVVGITRSFPSGRGESFSPNDRWFAHVESDTVKLLDLHDGLRKAFGGFTGYRFLRGSSVLCLQNEESGKLKLVNLSDWKETALSGVSNVVFDKSGTKIAFVEGEKPLQAVRYIDLAKGHKSEWLPLAKDGQFESLSWNETGRALALLRKTGDLSEGVPEYELWLYDDVAKKEAPAVLKKEDSAFPEGDYLPLSPLHVSSNGTAVFFETSRIPDNRPNSEKNSIVQIWHNNESQLPPSEKDADWFANRPKWTAWLPKAKSVRVLETQDYENAVLVNKEKFALLYRTGNYRPHYLYHGDYTDAYLMNLSTGELRLVAKKIHDEYARIIVSKGGNHILYFKEKQWWSYDVLTAKTVSLTGRLDIAFENEEFDRSREKGPYGCGGWMNGGEYVLLYDKFDVWLVSPDGQTRKRLTTGRENNLIWRMAKTGTGKLVRESYSGLVVNDFSLSEGFCLKFRDHENHDEGLAYYSKGHLRHLARRSATISDIYQSDDAKTLVFAESRFDSSPSLQVLENNGDVKLLAQANGQQAKFDWGKSELIRYSVGNTKLKGVLIWPAGYVAGKKYPMIVNIYEKKSHLLHEYTNPSTALSDGFNATDFSLEGYFVLLPDIVFTPNEPGKSALNCITAAVNAVLEKGVVDKDALGLVGHSFGGYETALTITQTDMFKAAVAGAMVTDPVGYYLTLDGWGNSNMWRFEEYQMRIRAPYYGPEFRENSPVMNADKINTPLLIWVGDKDGNIPWWESMKLNNALWRLKKKHVFLVYKGEDHVLLKKESREDLYKRMMHWFAVHLKDATPEDWAN